MAMASITETAMSPKKRAGLAFFDALFQLFTVLENFKKIPMMLEKNEFKSLKN